MNNPDFARTRSDVVDACRELARSGLVTGTAGNVSVRHGDAIAITASGVVLADAVPDDVLLVSADGRVLEGAFAPTSELELHLTAYRRSEVGAVVHTHGPAAVALTLITDELPCLHYQQIPLGGEVPVVPFSVFGSPELAHDVNEILIERNAVLLAHHGAVTVGSDLKEAVSHTALLEWACGLYLRAAAVGRPRRLTTDQQLAVITATVSSGYGSKHDRES